jgi:DtxR family Mn-dependent transcriptional regulator
MHSLTVENYIKSIYQICAAQSGRAAATGQIAAALGVSPSTVTAMLKTLSEGGLATYAPYEGARLTNSGSALALRVLRRHRLIELFLSQTLQLAWDEVHEEAENMEHAVSDRLIDRIDAFLGYPKVDPHGDPIPQADGTVEAAALHPLCTARAGERFRLARVIDQSPDFLRFLAEAGLPLETEGQVVANQTAAGMLTVQVAGREIHLGHDAAEKLLVAPIR